MFYVRIQNGKAVAVTTEFPRNAILASDTGSLKDCYEYRGNWKALEIAQQRAAELNVASGRWAKTGGTWTLVQGIHNERNPSF